MTVDVHNWTAGATTACGGSSLDIIGIEVTVALSVFRSIPIEPADNSGQDA